MIDNLKLNLEAKIMIFEDKLQLNSSKLDSKINNIYNELSTRFSTNCN